MNDDRRKEVRALMEVTQNCYHEYVNVKVASNPIGVMRLKMGLLAPIIDTCKKIYNEEKNCSEALPRYYKFSNNLELMDFHYRVLHKALINLRSAYEKSLASKKSKSLTNNDIEEILANIDSAYDYLGRSLVKPERWERTNMCVSK